MFFFIETLMSIPKLRLILKRSLDQLMQYLIVYLQMTDDQVFILSSFVCFVCLVVCLCLFVCLSVVCLSVVFLSVCLLSVCLSVCLSIHIFDKSNWRMYMEANKNLYRSSECLSVCLSVCSLVYLSVCLSVCLSVH